MVKSKYPVVTRDRPMAGEFPVVREGYSSNVTED